MKSSIVSLLNRSDIWQASATQSVARRKSLATGYLQLDQSLHCRGFPEGAITELLGDFPDSGLSLLAPAMASLSCRNNVVLMVNPPYQPCAQALRDWGVDPAQVLIAKATSLGDQLWTLEQALQSGGCAMVVSWLPSRGVAHAKLRKLQVACDSGQSMAMLFRHRNLITEASPALLRLAFSLNPHGYELRVVKQPGGWSGQRIAIGLPDELTRKTKPPGELPVYVPQRDRVSPILMPLSGCESGREIRLIRLSPAQSAC
ncbi:MAG: translesion DNA synthesis-associated protein ImuA [bacterium]